MTRIKYKIKPVWHESGTVDSHSGRAMLIAESPANLLIRLKGTRQVLALPWTLCFLRAASLKAAMLRLDKMNKRKQAKVARGRV